MTTDSWRGMNALLLGVFQATLFCPGLRRTGGYVNGEEPLGVGGGEGLPWSFSISHVLPDCCKNDIIEFSANPWIQIAVCQFSFH
jgi:hypothetical protein